MENKQDINIADLKKFYTPQVHDGCDKATNLDDTFTGYYAYQLQELVKQNIGEFAIESILADRAILCGNLTRHVCPIKEPRISYEYSSMPIQNQAKILLEMYAQNPNIFSKQKAEMTEHGFNEYLESLKAQSAHEQVLELHNFELFMRLWPSSSHGEPVSLRNGYLLKCLLDAGVTDINQLAKNYNAVVISNNTIVNGGICAFVKFEPKPDVDNLLN